MAKKIKGFPGYTIDSSGTVRNASGKKLSPRKDKDGYMRVDVRKNGKRFTRFIHDFVSGSHKKGNGEETHHKDGDRTNNSSKNLKRMSHKENMKYVGKVKKKKS